MPGKVELLPPTHTHHTSDSKLYKVYNINGVVINGDDGNDHVIDRTVPLELLNTLYVLIKLLR